MMRLEIIITLLYYIYIFLLTSNYKDIYILSFILMLYKLNNLFIKILIKNVNKLHLFMKILIKNVNKLQN
jgi:hypothetical protein